MKVYLAIFTMILMMKSSVAQAIKTLQMNAPKPLYILFSHNQTIVNADTLKGFHDLPSRYIQSINVLKDSAMVKKYGANAKNGVIEIYLDDEKFPKAFDSLKKASFKIIPPSKQQGKMVQG